jgi:hypothetical protein
MAKKDAEVTIGADATAVERAMAVGKASVRDLANSMQSEIGAAASKVVQEFADIALSAGKVSFHQQHAQVRELEASTARLAVASHTGLESMRRDVESTGIALGKRPQEVAAWTREVGQLTYNFKGAHESLRGINALAAETGRNAEDYRGLAVELGTVGRVSGDTTHAIGVMHAQADALKTVGGVAAFAQQVEGLTDTISHFRTSSEADFTRVTGLAAELGKGLSDSASRRVQASAFGSVANDPMGWSRYLGRDITDEHGQVKDSAKVLEDITEKIKRTYGKDSRRMLMLQFGSETGAALSNANFEEARRLGALGPTDASQVAQKQLLATDAGKRDVAEAQLAESSRKLLGSSTMLGQAADKLQQFAASNPITSTLISTAIGGTLGSFMSTFGSSIATMMGGKGAGGALGGAMQLAGAGGGLGGAAALAKLGLAGGVLAAGLYGIDQMDQAAEERFKLERKAEDSAANSALQQKRLAIKRTNAALHHLDDLTPEQRGAAINATSKVVGSKDAMAALAFSHGGGDSLKDLIAELRKEGKNDEDAVKIGKAVADALKQAGIVPATAPPSAPSPVHTTAKNAHSNAAGYQGHG